MFRKNPYQQRRNLVAILLKSLDMASLTDEQQWEEFKKKHNKSYGAEEEQTRFKIFQESLKKVAEHNAKYEKGEVTFSMAINHMSDLTTEEMKQRCGFRPSSQ
ncbi:cathepsin L-like proteinase [Aethina tumida]|uniref:cathepsin L-like proteinase n=1 Tax=Aethina tumida TaxID=116153 RepID=UPI0021482D34|nr:cathepsin L-like proteinase [Aethina tumida]